MFRLIEPSPSQFTKHTEGTFSNVHIVGYKMFTNRMTIKGHKICKHFGIPQCAHLMNVPSVCFVNWPDDGSMSRNMLPDLYIDNKLFVVFRLN